MRSSILAVLLTSALSTLAIAGCSADAQHGAEDGDAPATLQADALSKLGKTIVGSYKSEAWYPRFELKADGTYSWDTGIRCVRAPCPSGDAGDWKIYRGASGSQYVNLVSKPAGEDRWFRIHSGPPVVLEGVWGTTGKFTKEGSAPISKCATVRCAAGFLCDDSSGTATCVALPKDYCVSDADCKLVDKYCGGCVCMALASWATPPTCTDPVNCFVAPCMTNKVACVSNQCVVQ
jgi:hypothetical protein